MDQGQEQHDPSLETQSHALHAEHAKDAEATRRTNVMQRLMASSSDGEDDEPDIVSDMFGVMQFDNRRIEKIISDFRGLDKLVYQHLMDSDRLTEMGLRLACMEIATTGATFTSLMVSHGNIRQEDLVELSLRVDPRELAIKELIEPSVPHQLLRRYKAMLHAITETHVFLSSLSNHELTRRALSVFFPHHQFYFVAARVKSVMAYLEKVERYGKQQGTLLEVLIRKAIREKVSDIHIYPTRNGYNLKNRYLGQLYIERVGGLEEYTNLITKAKLESGLDPANRRIPQSGQFSIDYNGRPVDLRVETCPSIGSKETCVIRILDPENSQVHFRDLGITEVEEVIKALRSPNGVFLICGVTGSGKTTTATSALRWVLDRFSQAISTIEDPVENELSDIKQTQVDHRSGLTFAKVLRSILRQDPDTIVLGEIRDEETAQVAFQAAETGHLLMGTLHVKDIRGVFSRLEGLKVDREKILGQLRGVLVQKLIRVVCPVCKGEGNGCTHCGDKLYVSRTVVSEAVYLHDENDVARLMDFTVPRWWKTIVEDAFAKYIRGETDRREMKASFGTAFDYQENIEADLAIAKVRSGEMSGSQFKKLFPAHRALLSNIEEGNLIDGKQ